VARSYLLDTSAIFAYTNDEEGSGTVEEILTSAKRGKQKVYLSFISLMESYYVTWQERGEEVAKELMMLIAALPIERVESDPRITLSAGRIKAQHRLSVADAFVGATAVDKAAVLVHKDPEMETLSQYVETIALPYKSANK
jgi:predicted nucleic acid-binding protein